MIKECHGNCQRGHSTIKANVTEVAIKDKDKNKARDLSYIKCYTYKQKDHYINKYPKKPKT